MELAVVSYCKCADLLTYFYEINAGISYKSVAEENVHSFDVSERFRNTITCLRIHIRTTQFSSMAASRVLFSFCKHCRFSKVLKTSILLSRIRTSQTISVTTSTTVDRRSIHTSSGKTVNQEYSVLNVTVVCVRTPLNLNYYVTA